MVIKRIDFGKGKLVTVPEKEMYKCPRCGGYYGKHKTSCVHYGQDSVFK